MTASHGSRELAALVRELRRHGWRIRLGNAHYRAWPPDGGRVLTFSTRLQGGNVHPAVLAALRRALTR